MNTGLSFQLVKLTQQAALACVPWIGKGDKTAADRAAVNVMRQIFNELPIQGKIVIGEGERDEAPMLFIGETVGTGKGPALDFAVDPLECTNNVALNRPNSISVLAVAPAGMLLAAPDCYMHKIAAGPKAKDKVDLDFTPAQNIQAVAKALNKLVSEVRVCVLERERNQAIIQAVRATGAKLELFSDGDVSFAISTALPEPKADLLLGSGAAPEGVITAVALRALGGHFQGRLLFADPEQKHRAQAMGVQDLNKKLEIEDMVKTSDAQFIASGIQSGPLMEGISSAQDRRTVSTLVLNAQDHTMHLIKTFYEQA